MRRKFGTIGVTVFFCVLPVMLESAEQRRDSRPLSGYALPAEPDEFDRREVYAYYDWRNNMFFRVFKLASQESRPDFMTARRTYKVSINQYGHEVAVTFAHPLFYWVDLDGNGEFEPGVGEMWIDVEEDSVNGNERLYDPMTPGEGPRGPVPIPPPPTGRSPQSM